MDFWKAIVNEKGERYMMRATPHGATRVTVACVLLNEVAACDRPAREVAMLFNQSDADGSGWVDLNEAVAALIDAVDANYSRLADTYALTTNNPSILRRDYRNVEGLADAYPVAVRMMRELDLDHGGSLGQEEFIRGMRLVLDTCGSLTPPLLTTMVKDSKRLLRIFEDYDLNKDGSIDVNEWMLMIPYLHHTFKEGLANSADLPHRNRVLRALRLGKRAIAERRQGDMLKAADKGVQYLMPNGEPVPEGPLPAELMLTGLEAVMKAEGAEEAAAKRERKKDRVATAVLEFHEKERKKKKKKKKKKKRGSRE